jgi:octaprenyl-diphosphate synthase
MTANDTATGEDAYLDVIRAKTATLFEAACRIGAVVAERPAAEEQALAQYGRELGMAYQLVDDVLDYQGGSPARGKTPGDDFRDGKVTLPVVLAFARGDDAERVFWRRTIEDTEQEDGDFARATELLARHGALAETLERARAFAESARAALALFREGPERRVLTDVAAFCVERGF